MQLFIVEEVIQLILCNGFLDICDCSVGVCVQVQLGMLEVFLKVRVLLFASDILLLHALELLIPSDLKFLVLFAHEFKEILKLLLQLTEKLGMRHPEKQGVLKPGLAFSDELKSQEEIFKLIYFP